MCFNFENEGKSGSAQGRYVDFEVKEMIYFITVYPKSEKDNLTKAEKIIVIKP